MDNRHVLTESRIGLQEKRSTVNAASVSDRTMLRSGLDLSIVFLIAIYVAFLSPGTASGEFAPMTVFP